jgi:Kelch motif/Galactose oxidase, central domain
MNNTLTRRQLLAAAAATVAGCGGGGDGGAGAGGGPGGAGPGSFSAVASMRTRREAASGARLPSGRVLVAGGRSGGTAVASVEIFDPVAGQWGDAAPMRSARSASGSSGFLVALPDGRVLALGSTAELYDPATDSWALLPAPPAGMGGGAKTLLADGRLLVVPNQSTQVHLYDPANGRWTAAGGLDGRRDAAVVQLADGRVLVSGGRGTNTLATALLFDPATLAWRSAGTMRKARYGHFSFVLPNGRAVVSHGVFDDGTSADTTEVYDPAAATWLPAGGIHKFGPSVVGASGTPMPGGRYLVAGGAGAGNGGVILDQVPQGLLDETNAEWFDPATLAWQRATRAPGGLVTPRAYHVAVALADGSVLVAGGTTSTLVSGTTAAAEIYRG